MSLTKQILSLSMVEEIQLEAGTFTIADLDGIIKVTFTIPDPIIIKKQVEDLEKSLVVKGLATNPDNDTINYKVVVTGSIRKGSAANPADVISDDGRTLYGKINPQVGIDNYFVIGDIVSVEAPVDLSVTLDGVSIPVTIPPPPTPTEKHLIIKGDPANDNRTIAYSVTIAGGVTRIGPEASPVSDLIVGTNITARIYSGITPGIGISTDDYFFTGTLESINSSVNLVATVDGIPFPVTIVEPSPPAGKHLEIRGDPANLINKIISYTVTISGGVTTLGLRSFDPVTDFIIGTNIEGKTKAKTGFDDYFFTGEIVSVNSPVNLLVTVDYVPFPVITPTS